MSTFYHNYIISCMLRIIALNIIMEDVQTLYQTICWPACQCCIYWAILWNSTATLDLDTREFMFRSSNNPMNNERIYLSTEHYWPHAIFHPWSLKIRSVVRNTQRLDGTYHWWLIDEHRSHSYNGTGGPPVVVGSTIWWAVLPLCCSIETI